MRSIHQFFVGADQALVRRVTTESRRKGLCWYPSAGNDFRHIRLLEEEGLSGPAERPALIYLHTDMLLPKHSPSNPSRLLATNDQIAPGMRIVNMTELHLKQAIREVSSEVCSLSADENTGRVFLLEVEMDRIFYKRLVRVPVPILYFIAENLSFLVHALLRYQLQVDTLIHIRDGGGSMGGSYMPMNFIYQVASVLKLKRVICDDTPEEKRLKAGEDFDVLMRELRRCERYDDEYLLRRNLDQIHKISARDVRAAWQGRRRNNSGMASNEHEPMDDSYCDWHPISQVSRRQPTQLQPIR